MAQSVFTSCFHDVSWHCIEKERWGSRETVPDCQVNVSWDDSLFLVISRCIARQFKDLCCEVLEHCSYIHLVVGDRRMRKQEIICLVERE